MGKKKDLPEWDDGRTIANMNAEGMPWYTPGDGKAAGRSVTDDAGSGDSADSHRFEKDKPELLTGKESLFFTAGALKAALLVVGVMSAAIIIAVALMLAVWNH